MPLPPWPIWIAWAFTGGEAPLAPDAIPVADEDFTVALSPSHAPAKALIATEAKASSAVTEEIPVADDAEPPAAQTEGTFKQVAPGVLVKAKRTIFRTGGIIEFSEGVEALYDVTSVKADRLVLHTAPGEEYGEASGKVLVVDLDGTLEASDLRFCWKEGAKEGIAQNVLFEADRMRIEADTVTIKGNRWEALNARLTPCSDFLSFFKVTVPRVSIEVGRNATVRNPSFYFGGKRVGTLPSQKLSLDRRTTGFKWPGVSYRKGKGLGLTWSAGQMLTPATSLEYGFSAFPQKRPNFDIQWTKSWVPEEKAKSLLAPRSEMAERFGDAWLERIDVRTPESEDRYQQLERHAVTVSSQWNRGAHESYRIKESNFSKFLEVAYERGADLGLASSLTQIRLHSIRQGNEPFTIRSVLNSTIATKPIRVGKDLDFRTRLDLAGYFGEEVSGWARASAGLVWQPNALLRFGGAYSVAGSRGNPLFPADGLVGGDTINGRADLNLGPTKISFLIKFDRNLGSLFDREYIISQVAGCFEPFVIYRQDPSDYRFGVRFRGHDFLYRLRNREIARKANSTTVISSHGHK